MGLLNGIFDKGGQDAPPPMPPMPDYSADISQLMGAMAEMQAQSMMMMEGMMANAQMQQASLLESMQGQGPPTPPGHQRSPGVDWTEKQGQLNQKAKADYAQDVARRRGMTSGFTTPLLDEEEPELAESLLTGSVT